MSQPTRRAFLGTLAAAAVAPAALGRAVAAPPLSTFDAEAMSALRAITSAPWDHWSRNPAWIAYELLAQQHGPDAIDLDSVWRVAAYCEESVPPSSP